MDLDRYLNGIIEWAWRCTWRLRSTELKDACGGHDWQSLGYTPTPWGSNMLDANGSPDRVIRETNLEAVLKPVHSALWGRDREVRRCTWRQWSSEIGGVLRGGQSGGDRSGGRRNGTWDWIHSLTDNCQTAESWALHSVQNDERWETGCERQTVDLKWCRTWCMHYLVNAELSAN